MFDLLRRKRGAMAPAPSGSPRQLARERTESALRRDRLEVMSSQRLTELRHDMLAVIGRHLPAAADFEEFGLYREDGEVYLVSRVRLERRRSAARR